MDSQDLADPSDWTTTCLPFLRPLEAALHCHICKDLYTAPMITTCSHTFCSRCIREALQRDRHCPVCRTSELAVAGLRKNNAIQEAVDAFSAARERLMEIAGRHQPPAKPAPTPKPKPNKKAKRTDCNLSTASAALDPPESAREPLAVLNYSSFKKKPALQEKLRRLGLPERGKLEQLKARHRQWVTIWNSELDSNRPRSKDELLEELTRWELAHAKPVKNPTKEDGWSDRVWEENNEEMYAGLEERARGGARRKRKRETAKDRKIEEDVQEGGKRAKFKETEVDTWTSSAPTLVKKRSDANLSTLVERETTRYGDRATRMSVTVILSSDGE